MREPKLNILIQLSMSEKRTKKKKGHVFGKESKYLNHAEKIREQASELSQEELAEEYKLLADQYALLLGDAKIVTSVSDRLQNKVNKANDQILDQNEKLRQTIRLLKEARAGKKATTIVLLLAIVLFLFSEAFLEPKIERFVDDWYVGLLLKGIIAVILKPIESLVEKYLYKRSVNAELQEVA